MLSLNRIISSYPLKATERVKCTRNELTVKHTSQILVRRHTVLQSYNPMLANHLPQPSSIPQNFFQRWSKKPFFFQLTDWNTSIPHPINPRSLSFKWLTETLQYRSSHFLWSCRPRNKRRWHKQRTWLPWTRRRQYRSGEIYGGRFCRAVRAARGTCPASSPPGTDSPLYECSLSPLLQSSLTLPKPLCFDLEEWKICGFFSMKSVLHYEKLNWFFHMEKWIVYSNWQCFWHRRDVLLIILTLKTDKFKNWFRRSHLGGGGKRRYGF